MAEFEESATECARLRSAELVPVLGQQFNQRERRGLWAPLQAFQEIEDWSLARRCDVLSNIPSHEETIAHTLYLVKGNRRAEVPI